MLSQLQKGACALGCVQVILDGSAMELKCVPSSFHLNLANGVTLTDEVAKYSAVMSDKQQLVNCGDYVKVLGVEGQVYTHGKAQIMAFCSLCPPLQIHCLSLYRPIPAISLPSIIPCHLYIFLYSQEFAILIACVAKEDTWLCLVRDFERMECDGQPITNDYGCPLLTLTQTIRCVSPQSVASAVSIIHECNSSCSFVQTSRHRRVEREELLSASLVYQHDWSNLFFCLNIFCMNQ